MSKGRGFGGLDAFIKSVDRAASKGVKKEIALWGEAAAFQFLDEVQNEIIRTKTVDTRRLLNSFGRGDSDNVWQISKGGLSLEVGTNVDYASFVNDGHFTVDPNSGKDRRWVPGRWSNNRFVYDPSSKEGMLLKIKWVDGTGYWDNAQTIFQKMFNKSLDKKLQSWIDRSFEGKA
ncbi:HK97 gp10 family phage protein [Shouchella clausii]|uniref:HK97 gp10 family phage protein n=1 Tax=Shouchella clausii TaxID=79880 RepID=UPI001C73BC74|nr:HK97 gp10 family phage protein [Shouchella clausii]MBX0319754.1 HK97 gp10 family phage protein [Shouchella clausii]